jgi:hypothetical protein
MGAACSLMKHPSMLYMYQPNVDKRTSGRTCICIIRCFINASAAP